MRKLKLQVQMSVDGYIADIHGKTDWMLWNWSDEWTWSDALKKYHYELTESSDCVLLSRKMIEEGFISHWAKVAENRNGSQYAFAKNLNEIHKVVFSTTLKRSEWDNTVLAKGDISEEVNQLKKQPGKDIIVYGGAIFVSSLIKAGLIDEFHLFINPTALGDGKTIFRALNGKQDLTLVNAESYDGGILVLKYVLKRD